MAKKTENEKSNDWERDYNPQHILYTMNVLNDYGCNYEKNVVASAINSLPDHIQKKVLKEMVFVFSLDEGAAESVQFDRVLTKGELKNKKVKINHKLIILNIASIRRLKLDQFRIMEIVAHEVAHHILGHCKYMPEKETKNSVEMDREADDLIEKWGFDRVYTEEKLKARQEFLDK